MEYNKKLVEKAGEVYAKYLIENWRPGGPSGVLTDREYRALKKRAVEYLRKTLPSMNLFYAEWLKLVKEHGPHKAHGHVTNTAQETGRRIWIGLSAATNRRVLNTSNRMVINPDGTVKGKRRAMTLDHDDPVSEPAMPPATSEDNKSTLEAYKWRVLGCATHGGVLPSPIGLAELLDISHADAEGLLDWLGRTHVLYSIDDNKGFTVEPKPLDAHKLLELFHNQDRNPLELRALEALLDAMAD